MSRRPIPPHRILLDHDLILPQHDAWEITCGDGSPTLIPNAGVIEGWEPGMEIKARKFVGLSDGAHARIAGGHADPLSIRLTATAYTAGGLETAARTTVDISPDSDEPYCIEMLLDGDLLARDIRIHLGAVLGEVPLGGDKLTPKIVGARLWNTRWRCRIEGGRARLPIEAIDFESYFGTSKTLGGLIHVVVAEDPNVEVEQGLLVYLNSAASEFITEVSRREPRATAILWDALVRRVIVAGSELNFSSEEEYPDGSVGQQWQIWARGAFGRKSAEDLLSLHRSDNSRFELIIQSWIGMRDKFAGRGVAI